MISAIKNEKLYESIPSGQMLNESLMNEGKHANSNFEFGISNLKLGSVVIAVNPRYYRPTEVVCPFGKLLIGNPKKANETFGWEAKTKFDELAKMMAREDFKKVLKRGF